MDDKIPSLVIASKTLKRVRIVDEEGNERGIISFDAEDILFIDRVMRLSLEYKDKIKEYSEQAEAVENDELAQTKIVIELCEYMKSSIDKVFGEGTSKIAFGDMNNFGMFGQFFEGIAPLIDETRAQKTAKYRKTTK